MPQNTTQIKVMRAESPTHDSPSNGKGMRDGEMVADLIGGDGTPPSTRRKPTGGHFSVSAAHIYLDFQSLETRTS